MIYGVGFYYRKKLVCDSEEVIRERQIKSLKAAEEYERKFAELTKEHEAKLAAANKGTQ